MLDSETKRRIDSARDILVGKVPDPKSQVEQITIALVYKFMDDMDQQSVDIGGKRSFFKGKFAKYGWGNIFDPRLGGIEMLALYGEAITQMSQNENLPQLFRDIFKNAYLPYRDPETLKLFLKTINDFTYDHSEKLGDAFEYLLSVLGSQGDAGQFRTPRHIIDFMVRVVSPQKNETVLDPACGTAGFLISAYKYILESNKKNPKGLKDPSGLTTQDKQKLYENFTGYDISPDMVRLSLVNLYLHGFVKPQIYEYDTLASEDRWNEYADVILANPPFMSPKGGIMPHKKFSVQSNRSEVLFVDYMAEHLTPKGRAAIIVPEGIIFQSAGAYKQLRKYLIENNFLWAVVSLPAGVFNPYAGVKTSILFLDKSLAKKTDQILFVKVEADGFDLGAQRRPIDKNDLPDALNTLRSWHKAVLDGKPNSFVPTTDSSLLVSIPQLAETGDYNLSPDRYREVIRVGKQTHPMVLLSDVIDYVRGVTYSKNDEVENGGVFILRANNINANQGVLVFDDLRQIKPSSPLKDTQLLKRNDILICAASGSAEHIGKVAIAENDTPYYFGGFMGVIRVKDELEPKFLFYLLRSSNFRQHIESASVGVNIKNLNSSTLASFQIPLPPLETQRQLVDEIAAHQRIIDGARQVVEGWKPDIEVELQEFLPDGVDEWSYAKLDDVCDSFKNGANFSSEQVGKGVKYVNIKDVFAGRYVDVDLLDRIDLTDKEIEKVKLKDGDVVFIRSSVKYEGVGYPALIKTNGETIVFCGFIIKCSPKPDLILPEYLLDTLQTEKMRAKVISLSNRSNITNISQDSLKSLEIHLPPMGIQREIVARIETERKIVEGNRELIRLYEEKVKKVIERVWEG